MLKCVKQNKRGPILGGIITILSKNLLGLYQRLPLCTTFQKILIEANHQVGSRIVVDILQTHQQCMHACIFEPALKTEDAVASKFSESCFTS